MRSFWLALAVTASTVSPAVANGPAAQLANGLDTFVQIVADRDAGPARHGAIRALAEAVFDFGETAKRVLGRHWAARTPEEQATFVRAFTEFIDRAYLRKAESYSGGARLVVTGEEVRGDDATVSVQLVAADGDRTPIDFMMLRAPTTGAWRAYDVRIGGISLAATYRAQFDRIIRARSYEELIGRLGAKAGEASARPR